jgi:AcrR family transcriptional regulator
MPDPHRLRTQRPERYRAILEAACAEFAQRGFERANVNTIAEQVGVAKGTLYNYAASKQDLFLQSVEYAAGQVIAHLKTHVSPTALPEERMRQLVLADLTFMDQNQGEYMLMVAVFYGANFLYGQGATYLPVAMGAYREFFSMVDEICGQWMGHEQLEARGGQAVTFQVLALIEAANLTAWANPEQSLDRQRDADHIMTMLKSGLCPAASWRTGPPASWRTKSPERGDEGPAHE